VAGTIVTDRIESDASYASSVNIASPLVIANTISLGSAAAITGNVNIDSGLLFVDGVNNRVGIGTQNPSVGLDVRSQSIYLINSSNPTSWLATSTALANSMYIQMNTDSNEGRIGTYSNHNLSFLTNNSSRMTVDTSGRVTKPFQPAFRARKTASQTIQNNSADIKVTFDTADTNIGSHYNTSTSRFTAPVAGWYHFNAFFMYESFPTDWAYSFIRFVLNGSSSNSEIMYGRIPSGSNYLTLCASTYYYLSVNDYFEVFTRIVSGSSNAQIRGSFAEFSGMLVC
jgi:hypothetical protein